MRRHVLILFAALTGAALLAVPGPDLAAQGGAATGGVLKGFIIADAHFGWDSPQQPSPEEQRQMLHRILKRFPDLDVLMDVGDAYHSVDPSCDEGRRQWSDVVVSGCGPIPFFYIAGNHELAMDWRHLGSEATAKETGSVSCRPYYSFDLKGIHFVSLPVMFPAAFVTRESLDWLALDLALNRDKSVIVLSHNAIKSTTFAAEPFYRQILNSDKVLAVLDRHPNVLAWMHGHNHLYQVVPKGERLYVSCGRFGGFGQKQYSRFGTQHLGGTYFEVRPDGLLVRSYSASAEKFLDELGMPQCSGELSRKTSLDPASPAGLSYGSGDTQDGQRMAAYHYHVGGKSQLFIAGAADAVINEDPTFVHFLTGWFSGEWQRQFPAFPIAPKDAWEYTDPGVRLRAIARKADRVIANCGGGFGWYDAVPGKTYVATLDLYSASGGQQMQLTCDIADRDKKQTAHLEADPVELTDSEQTRSTEFKIPELKETASLYSDPSSDDWFAMKIGATFTKLQGGRDVYLRRFAIMRADTVEGAGTENAGVIADGRKCIHGPALKADQLATLDLPPLAGRSVYEISAKGNRRCTWLVRQTGVKWQVRNAPAADHGDYVEVGPFRNRFSAAKEIIIAPLVRTETPFAHKLRNANRARLYPFADKSAQLRIDVLEALGPVELEVRSDRQPRRVAGADHWEFQDGLVLVKVGGPGTISLEF